MNVMVVGSGGREHALVRSLLQSPEIQQIWVAPGNGGTATLPRCQNLPVAAEDIDGLVQVCQEQTIDLVVVGPEVPLALGLVDRLQSLGIPAFGPGQRGAQLEASKAWAKTFMVETGIPTARSATFNDRLEALAYVRAEGAPIVIKADGLAAGKGVTVAMTLAEAEAAIEAAFGGKFGSAGQCLVIEEYLTGVEVSILALTDGQTLRPLLPAQDHKRIGEGDTGENTGGMGAYAPAPLVTPELLARITTEILEPTIAGLQSRGIDYRGVLYAGLMITPDRDPKVIEFNCRFGDPETQVVLPLLETPLLEVILACIHQRLADLPLQWRSGTAATVVIAAPGYPGPYPKGSPITGIAAAEVNGAIVFHAGTQFQGESLVTSGGRVLTVTALGDNFDQSFASAYQAIHAIDFEGMYYRRDIGYQVRSQS
jgi:phosphoribosylamine---glycine ligase